MQNPFAFELDQLDYPLKIPPKFRQRSLKYQINFKPCDNINIRDCICRPGYIYIFLNLFLKISFGLPLVKGKNTCNAEKSFPVCHRYVKMIYYLKAYCRNAEAKLVEVDSVDEENFLRSHLISSHTSGLKHKNVSFETLVKTSFTMHVSYN